MTFQKVYNQDYDNEEIALLNVDTNEIIIRGDWYHDSIEDYIRGFIEGLEYGGIKVEVKEDFFAQPNTELFKRCNFY